jgi:hypothetical protein
VSSPLGNVDVVAPLPGGIRVSGWVIDPRVPNAYSVVRVSVDGQVMADAATSVSRPDVASIAPGYNPAAGYDISVVAAPGPHQVCVDLVYLNTGRTARLGCREVIVP